MKKTLFAVLTATVVMAAQVSAFAAAPAPTPAPAATAAAPAAAAQDPNKVIVRVNGVEMTQAQARLVILENIKNHRQMTPEEMVAYVNYLDANEDIDR